jgi:hypothetical protein
VPINTQETDKENIPEDVLSPRSIFFKSRTITGISDPSRKPRKTFVPPFLAGSLSKPNNITVLQAKKSKAKQATITDNSSQSVKFLSKSSIQKQFHHLLQNNFLIQVVLLIMSAFQRLKLSLDLRMNLLIAVCVIHFHLQLLSNVQ